MKNNIYFLIRSFLISLLFFLLLPSLSFAQGLPSIPDVGPTHCVANCGGGNTKPSCPNNCSGSDHGQCNFDDGSCDCYQTWSGIDCSVPSITQTHLQSATDLNQQALQELNEGKYIEASTTIDNTIESLNNVKDGLRTDPELLEFCKNKPEAINKIERVIQSSINNHKKAASIVDRIIEITSEVARINNNSGVNEEESLLQKLLRAAKRLLTRRMPKPSTVNAVCGVRG